VRVIAIDGPAGAGKSTVARALAARLGLDYLDTGAMYRAVVDQTTTVDGVDASVEIRGPEVTRAVSIVAANPAVREELRRRQVEWARHHGGGVIEGRDIGSVVFPDADLKLYLTAAAAVRAGRRHREVTDLQYEAVAASIAERDALDEGRATNPLVQADDAIVIDTTDRPVDDILDEIERLLK
jgi:CMP/dCMP kinase